MSKPAPILKKSSLSQGTVDCCSLREINRCGICEELNATTRNAILNLIKQVEKIKKLHFNKTELSILLHMCVEITGREVRDMTVDELKSFLYGTLDITNPYSLDGLCRAAMQNTRISTSKKTVSPVDFVQLLSVLLRGTLSERAELAFRIMDLDSDGLIRRNVEVRRFLHDTFDVSVAAQNPEIDPEEPVRDTMNYLCEKLQCTLTQPISVDRFKNLANEEPWIIESLLPCIPSEMTNLVFQTLFSTKVRLPSLENPPKIAEK
ncbi:EF-hand calcium-binding domain-containing protein 1 [Fasciola gigantica]|uniref:EF-hand calcium-binding domain-containing protein 1 n=1 Tax=Fasciola gigantica TaxID=46835 RepID=A0A504Z3V7_FASGI|nr:EF-hand calcium-binding domain-containing protein 1 [Fasciola gigantica]